MPSRTVRLHLGHRRALFVRDVTAVSKNPPTDRLELDTTSSSRILSLVRRGEKDFSHETYYVDELAEFELDADPEHVGRVDDGPHQLVVVAEEVVIEALGVGVAGGHGARQPPPRQPPQQRGHQLRLRRARRIT
ncbi:hypothetical protein EVAR_39036_1 [Eumeta japonica]|uniref:Uncharacterized protein n=1 Tax=Eumeta variegata TaxID=151549 RepID=A0A4C1WQR5_EUMVA|nr:hypothetical protein EVAR_39036_1 [Eumeta japonica]